MIEVSCQSVERRPELDDPVEHPDEFAFEVTFRVAIGGKAEHTIATWWLPVPNLEDEDYLDFGEKG